MWMVWVMVARGEVVDRILYVVGERIITASDVEFEAEFDAHDASPVAMIEQPAHALDQRLVDFAVLRELAGDIEVYRPATAEVRARFERFRAGWERPEDHAAFLKRWGLDEERLMGFIYSRLVIERYIQRNFGVTDASWAGWIDEQRGRANIRSTAK